MEEPMCTKIEIPEEVIPDVREALLSRLGDAAETVATEVARGERALHPERLAPGRDMFEDACELLDLIGWDGKLRAQSTEVDLREHGSTLAGLLENYVPLVEGQLDEVDVNDARRARQGEPPRRKALERSLAALRTFATVVEQRRRGEAGS
jgi:hypothetical protein